MSRTNDPNSVAGVKENDWFLIEWFSTSVSRAIRGTILFTFITAFGMLFDQFDLLQGSFFNVVFRTFLVVFASYLIIEGYSSWSELNRKVQDRNQQIAEGRRQPPVHPQDMVGPEQNENYYFQMYEDMPR